MTSSREAARARRPLRAGRRLFGRYRLRERIGRGGSAEVWRAVDERLDRPVAIKVLSDRLDPGPAWRARFMREARAAASLAHPAIVPVHDVVDDPATPAIVFRYIRGETLAGRLRRDGPLPPHAAIAIGTDLADGLQHAHGLGVVHRDVKPGNVVLDPDGRAQLVDFGIARLLADAAASEAPGQVLGTLRYMAPEQLAGETTDGATDVYALGVLIHEMLTGRQPFTGSTPAQLLTAERAGPPPPPPDAPEQLRPLLASMLAPDPKARPSAATVHETLARLALAAGGRRGLRGPAARLPDRRAAAGDGAGSAEPGDTTILDPAATIAMAPVAVAPVAMTGAVLPRDVSPAVGPKDAQQPVVAPLAAALPGSPTAPRQAAPRGMRRQRFALLGGLTAAGVVLAAALAFGLAGSLRPAAHAGTSTGAGASAAPTITAQPTAAAPAPARHRGKGRGRDN